MVVICLDLSLPKGGGAASGFGKTLKIVYGSIHFNYELPYGWRSRRLPGATGRQSVGGAVEGAPSQKTSMNSKHHELGDLHEMFGRLEPRNLHEFKTP